jgi:hypothetical protein
MMMRNMIGLILLMIFPNILIFAQHTPKPVMTVPSGYCISNLEYKLYKMINDYRRRYDLPSIPLSRALGFVAQTHAKDLILHPPGEPCNFHSWSATGPWKPICYPQDESKKNSVWDKPAELIGYKGKGYEIVYWENNDVTIDSVMAEWKNVDYFNSFLMNTGRWQEKKWNAIGIAIYENFAIAWFGEIADTDDPPLICGQQPEKIKSDITTINPPPQSSQSVTYHIIVQGGITFSEANKHLNDIKSNGFPNARVLTQGNKVRISVYTTNNKDSADSALRITRQKYQDAWILKN